MKITLFLSLILFCSGFLFAQENTPVPDCSKQEKIEKIEFKKADGYTELKLIKDAFFHAAKNKSLTDKVTVNGDADIAAILDQVLVAEIGEEKFRSEQYQVLDFQFIVNTDGTIENLYFGHEVYWYSTEMSKEIPYLEIKDSSPEEKKMAEDMLGLMEYDEIIKMNFHF